MPRHNLTIIIGLMAVAIAAVSATPYAGSWNDGSRLATVESLIDRHTWIIDESTFVTPPPRITQPHPYGPLADQMIHGTQDKLFINGHFYSDKSPVPALIMTASYQMWRWLDGPSAADRPDLSCWFLSLLWAGGAFVVAVLGIDRLAQNARLPNAFRLLIVASFAIGTIALPYSRSVNNHILLLAVATWLLVLIDRPPTFSDVLAIGTLAGCAYTIDLGARPGHMLDGHDRSGHATRSWSMSLVVAAAAFPWIAMHHGFNYMIGGTIGPANANPAFFHWPGCPFNESNLTGGWPHRSIGAFAVYALDTLVGKKGLFTHQPQLWLALAAVVALMKQQAVRFNMLMLTAGWCVGVWLLYAASSHNQSGVCVSIRWFVPLLASAFYWLIQALKFCPEVWKDLAILSCAGGVINLVNWYRGPWNGKAGPLLWIAVATAGAAWGLVHYRRTHRSIAEPMPLRRAA